jgi:hypothetical protein
MKLKEQKGAIALVFQSDPHAGSTTPWYHSRTFSID